MDRVHAQNFEAILVAIVKLAGEAIFVKFCQDTLKHMLRHPQNIHINPHGAHLSGVAYLRGLISKRKVLFRSRHEYTYPTMYSTDPRLHLK